MYTKHRLKIIDGARPGTVLDPQGATLQALVAAIAARDAGALVTLQKITAARSFTIALLILRCKEDAEEVVSDMYQYVWQSARAYDPARGSVATWLGIIAKNRAIDCIRRRRNVVSLDDQRYRMIEESLVGSLLGPDQMIALNDAENALRLALESLTATRRKLVDLAFFQGLTHGEISEVVAMPLGTVKSHLRRALLELRRTLR